MSNAGDGSMQAFFYQPGGAMAPLLPNGTAASTANSIKDAGQVTGAMWLGLGGSGGPSRAFLYSPADGAGRSRIWVRCCPDGRATGMP